MAFATFYLLTMLCFVSRAENVDDSTKAKVADDGQMTQTLDVVKKVYDFTKNTSAVADSINKKLENYNHLNEHCQQNSDLLAEVSQKENQIIEKLIIIDAKSSRCDRRSNEILLFLVKNSPKNHSVFKISDGARAHQPELETLSKEFCLSSGIEKIEIDLKRQDDEATTRHKEVLQKMPTAAEFGGELQKVGKLLQAAGRNIISSVHVDLLANLSGQGFKVDTSLQSLVDAMGNIQKDIHETLKEVKMLNAYKKNKQIACSELQQNLEYLKRLASGTYFIRRNFTSWRASKEFCELIGMRLATFDTEKEMKELAVHIGPTSMGLWVSASDIGRQQGHHFWEDGVKVNASLWDKGYPQNIGSDKESCVFLFANSESAKLQDWPCSGVSYGLCEMGPALADCLLRE